MKKVSVVSVQRQRGITFLGMLFVGALIGIAIIIAAKTVPALTEYQAITKAVNKASKEETIAEIQRSFNAAQAIDDFTAIEGKDLDISKENNRVKIRFAYDKEVVLYGPVSLLFHFKGESQ